MPESEELKELKSIKKLLDLLALRSGASPDNIDTATGMGAGNLRAMFPAKRRDKKIGDLQTVPAEGTPS